MSDGVAAELFAYGFTRAAFLNWTPPADGFHFEASAGEWPKNSDVIYVLADVESNRVLFVGHTGRARKRSENLASWLNGKSSDTPIRAAWLAVFIHANRGAERRASRKAAIRFMILVARQRHGRIEERHTRHGSG